MEERAPRRVAPKWLALSTALVGLVLAYALKSQCARHGWGGSGKGQASYEYSRLCYNDLQPLYEIRGIGRGLVPYRDVEVEYPPLTGVFMDLSGRLLRVLDGLGVAERGNPNYFHLSSILLTPFSLAITLMLRPLADRNHLMVWTLGTPTVLYSFHNWDLLAVAAAVWGMSEFYRGRDLRSGAGLALGAGAKLFPAFVVPGLFLSSWLGGRKSGARSLVGSFAVLSVVINVPWIFIASGLSPVFDQPNWPDLVKDVSIRSPSENGWLNIWTFHAQRYPDFGTVWYWLAHHGRRLAPAAWWDSGFKDFVSLVSLLVFAGGSFWFLYLAWRRKRREDSFGPTSVGLGILCIFLLVSKVHSPQYALWLVPFMVVLRAPWRLVIAYLAADLALYVSGFYWFTVFDSPAPGWKGIFEITVWARATVLFALARWAASAPPEPKRDLEPHSQLASDASAAAA